MESNGSIARILSPSYSDNHGSDSTSAEEVDVLHTGSATALTATSHGAPLPENSPSNVEALMAAAVDGCALFPSLSQQDENICQMPQQEISSEVKAAVEVASLRVLKEKLSNLPNDKKSELVKVQQLAPTLVDNHHLLLFLRAERFDVNVSVQ